jgi:Pregnancy-associated plasma protein-A/Secretion system C-terminal sorting domain
MKKSRILSVVLLWITLFGGTSIFAQRNYATNDYMAALKEKDPKQNENRSAIERYIYYASSIFELKHLTVPMVFHCLYTNAKDQPSTEQINAQIKVINRHFNGLELDEGGTKAPTKLYLDRNSSMDITFCLAATDPNGNLTTGVHFVEVKTPIKKDDWNSMKTLEATKIWDSKRYLNVWICPMDSTIAGYAQMPGGAADMDGIVINSRYFFSDSIATKGKPYTQGKTLTHLIGNFLGLYEMWGPDLCQDDYVWDTPVHNSPNYGYPGDAHITTCSGYAPEMWMNYMDNSDDQYLYMFTRGQVNRMQLMLAEGGPRYELTNGKIQCAKKLGGLEGGNPGSNPVNARNKVQVTIFPNPTQNDVEVAIYSPEIGTMQLVVSDLSGKVIQQRTEIIQVGNQRILLDCANWSPSVYFLDIRIGEEVINKKLIVNPR